MTKSRIIVAFGIALLVLSIRATAEERLVIPSDDLPEARVGAFRVAFSRNGAMMVEKNGTWLYDISLGYMRSSWKEWGCQIRRSSLDDGWKRLNERAVVFEGTLYDADRFSRFKFSETVILINGGLSIRYNITSLEKRPVDAIGVFVHLPTAVHAGRSIGFWPGVRYLEMAVDAKDSEPQGLSARAAVLPGGDGQSVSVVAKGSLTWQLFDDRQWNVNTYRLAGWDKSAAAALADGKSADVTFDLILDETADKEAKSGQLELKLDRYGRAAVLIGGIERLEGGPGIVAAKPVKIDAAIEDSQSGFLNADAAKDATCKVSLEQNEKGAAISCEWSGAAPADKKRALLLSGRLPSKIAILDSTTGDAVSADLIERQPQEPLLLSWVEGAAVEKRADNTLVMTWKAKHRVEVSADLPWSFMKKDDKVVIFAPALSSGGEVQKAAIRFRDLDKEKE